MTNMYERLNEHRTNHILHLILTVLTFGVWSVVWTLLACGDCIERNGIRVSCGEEEEPNVAKGLLIVLICLIILVIVL